MRILRKVLRLPASDLLLLAKLALLLGWIRLGLILLPFGRLRRILGRLARTLPYPRKGSRTGANRIIWAANALSPYLVGDNACLAKALAVQYMLHRRGCPVVLRIGVSKTDNGALAAHAWLEYQGKVILGGTDSPTHFTPLPSLAQESP